MATVTDFGGSERVVLTLIKNINSDLFEVVPVIFTRTKLLDTAFFHELNKAGSKYHTIFADKQRIKYINPVTNIIKAYRVVRKGGFDLIHTHGYRCDFIGIVLAKLTGLPIVSTCHGFISNDANLRFYNKLDLFMLKHANRVMAVSEGIKQDLILSGVRESRISLVQNAVERNENGTFFAVRRRDKRQQLNIDGNEFVVGYVGRLSEEKGIKYLLQAHLSLAKAGLPVKMVLIGDGPQKGELEKLVDGSGIKNSVRFAGFQPQIETWFPAMDVFVLPSLTEGTPMALLEAMNEGIPVIASAVGGVPQVLDPGRNGLLVPPGNSEQIAEAIRDLFADETLRQRLSDNGRRTIAERYNIADWVNKVETEYLQAVN